MGKTRLMGAFIAYLHLTHGLRDFLVLTPNLTIYDNFIADFTPDTPKYLFRGIAQFATDEPRPVKGQFQIFYRQGSEIAEYVPDFVAETSDHIFMLEPKMAKDMNSPEVAGKRTAALTWCAHASRHAVEHGAKPWRYALIPHEEVVENISLDRLTTQWVSPPQ